MHSKALFALLACLPQGSLADPETTEPITTIATEAASAAEDTVEGPYESLIQRCDVYEFPEDSFKKQPLEDKVYLRVDEPEPGPFKAQNITKFASAFGIRVVGDAPVADEKIIHVTNTLAKVLDMNNDGKPDNDAMIQELLNFHPILFIMSSSEKVMEMMNAQDPDDGFPAELKFCPYAFDFEDVSKINPGGPKADATCEEPDSDAKASENDRTLAFVLDHLMGRGYEKVMGEERKEKLIKIYEESIDAGTFDPQNTGCPPESESCGHVMLASWGLSTLLGFDECWCKEAHALKFCDAETLKKGEPELVELLETIFPGVEKLDDSEYKPSEASTVVH
eukprot:Blabericola_migrator_1__9152@NODE_48_length_16467_cov_53_390427_g44_i0_p4_GENE_NODE_48_length_16467_cov_53_390427_g44_i0NODE_48_length_16467_cov_53_390427_g44_i0_p4_ORF_typecomplete_len337_score67_43_NODE_48_length_16467_cov_53_390427_g44_i060067016